MRRHGRGITVSKWIGTVLCLALIAALPYSARRAISWDSPEIQYEVSLALGGVCFGWRPEGWDINAERYPTKPGWTVSSYGGDCPLLWWTERNSNRSWESLAIPLWIPFILLAIPTGILWYRDRRRARQATQRLVERLRPRRRLRLSLWKVAGFASLHVFVLIPACVGSKILHDFFYPPAFGEWRFVDVLTEWTLPVLFWGTPVWAGLWAWLWVRWRNHLLTSRPSHYCIECGYDLTGNTSGRCPECGQEIAAGAC